MTRPGGGNSAPGTNSDFNKTGNPVPDVFNGVVLNFVEFGVDIFSRLNNKELSKKHDLLAPRLVPVPPSSG